jgi:hypothetical protein
MLIIRLKKKRIKLMKLPKEFKKRKLRLKNNNIYTHGLNKDGRVISEKFLELRKTNNFHNLDNVQQLMYRNWNNAMA